MLLPLQGAAGTNSPYQRRNSSVAFTAMVDMLLATDGLVGPDALVDGLLVNRLAAAIAPGAVVGFAAIAANATRTRWRPSGLRSFCRAALSVLLQVDHHPMSGGCTVCSARNGVAEPFLAMVPARPVSAR